MSTKVQRVNNKSGANGYSQKTKRWYIDASIPKSVPFIGGAGFRAGSGNLNKRDLQALVKKSISAATEPKRKLITSQGANDMLHNTIYTLNVLGNIPVGAGNGSRISSIIELDDVKLKVNFSNFGSLKPEHTIQFRCMWIKSSAEHQQSSDTLASGLGSTDIFESGSGLLINSIVDKSKCTVLSDEVITLQPSGAFLTTKFQNCDVSLRQMKMKFNSPTSNYSDNKNLYYVVIPYVFGGVGGTTIVGATQYEAKVSFQDM